MEFRQKIFGESLHRRRGVLRRKVGRKIITFQGGASSLETVLPLRGLQTDRTYRVSWPAAFGPALSLSGRELLEKGLPLRFPQRGASAAIAMDPQ